MGIVLFQHVFGLGDHVDQDRPPVAVERDRVLVVAFPEDLPGGHPGHLLDRVVPGNDPALPVDGERGVGQEVDDIGEAFLRFDEEVLRLPPGHGLPDLVLQFGELGLCVASLLEVEVRAVVDRLDHDLFPARGEEDERDIAVPLADGFQERDPVHFGHLVIRDDGVAAADLRGLERFLRKGPGHHREIRCLFQELPAQYKQVRLVIHVQN